jgi:two-component system, OmpR family, response regulator
MTTILLVEDDTTIASMLSAYLEREKYRVVIAQDGEEAMVLFNQHTPNLVILDLNLPSRSGLEILPEMRKASQCPILILSARMGEDDRVASLELWADDFIAKPFSARELVARIARHLVRSPGLALKSEEVLSLWKVRIVTSKYLVEADWIEIKLTKTEFELLSHLLLHANEVIERDTLMKEIIGYERYLSDRTIDTHMKNLRKKFEGFLEIETLRAVGYKVRATS